MSTTPASPHSHPLPLMLSAAPSRISPGHDALDAEITAIVATKEAHEATTRAIADAQAAAVAAEITQLTALLPVLWTLLDQIMTMAGTTVYSVEHPVAFAATRAGDRFAITYLHKVAPQVSAWTFATLDAEGVLRRNDELSFFLRWLRDRPIAVDTLVTEQRNAHAVALRTIAKHLREWRDYQMAKLHARHVDAGAESTRRIIDGVA